MPIAFSADGQMLAVERADGRAISLLDAATQTLLATLVCDRELTRIEFSPVFPMLAAAVTSEGREAIELCYLTEPTATQSSSTPFDGQFGGQFDATRLLLDGFRLPVADVRFSPDGEFLAAASRATPRMRALVRIWETSSAQSNTAYDLPGPTRITFSPDSQFLAASGPDQAVRIVSLRTTGPVDVLPGSNAAFSPTPRLLATTEPAGARLWTLPQGA